MPLYEYECEACHSTFEKIQKFSDPLVEVCPKCGKGPVRKLPSSPAIQFKGSGWYITDYARKSSTEGQTTKSGADKSEKSDSTTKTDSSTSKTDNAKPSTTKND